MIFTEDKYVKLSDQLPLDTPFTLMIDPTNVCNFKCTFCPTGDESLLKRAGRPIGKMDFPLFCKIIEDLREFPRKVRSLRLFKDGEPFVNRDLIKMIAFAKQKDVAEEVYIISNASLIRKEIADGILDSRLDRLRISVEHVTPEKYKALTKTYEDYRRIVENVRYLYEEKTRRSHHLHINAKIVDTGLSSIELEKFRNDFGPISDELTIESLMGWSSTFDKDMTLGSKPRTGIDGRTRIAEIEVCPEPFKGLAINFDGTVSVCCVDWSHGTLVGDTRQERLVDIWNGPRLHAFRMFHLQKERKKIPACANCRSLKGHKDMSRLDDMAAELLERFTQININEVMNHGITV